MTNDDRLSYCNICLNRSSLGEFTICGLTEKYPDFIERCDNFSIDSVELKNQKESISNEYIESKSLMNKIFSNSKEFRNTNSFKTKIRGLEINANEETKLYMKTSSFITKFLIVTILMSLCYYMCLTMINNIYLNITGGLLIFLYLAFLLYSRKNKKPILIIGKYGITHNNVLIPWHRILLTGIFRIDDGENISNRLIIHRHEEFEKIEIGIDDIISPEKISFLIELYKMKYKNNGD